MLNVGTERCRAFPEMGVSSILTRSGCKSRQLRKILQIANTCQSRGSPFGPVLRRRRLSVFVGIKAVQIEAETCGVFLNADLGIQGASY